MITFSGVAITLIVIFAILVFACFFLEPFYSSKDRKEYWVEDTTIDDDFDVDYE